MSVDAASDDRVEKLGHVSGPKNCSRPMCEMSNTPTALRVAWCSAAIDVYCTGIDQPAKSTIRPPCATCQSWSGVRARAVVMVIGGRSRQEYRGASGG